MADDGVGARGGRLAGGTLGLGRVWEGDVGEGVDEGGDDLGAARRVGGGARDGRAVGAPARLLLGG
jgi:hypothetical protein